MTSRSSCTVVTSSRAISSAGERFVHTEEVTGSIPVSPTAGQALSALERTGPDFVPACLTACPRRALAAPAHHQPDRVDLRHRPAPQRGHRWADGSCGENSSTGDPTPISSIVRCRRNACTGQSYRTQPTHRKVDEKSSLVPPLVVLLRSSRAFQHAQRADHGGGTVARRTLGFFAELRHQWLDQQRQEARLQREQQRVAAQAAREEDRAQRAAVRAEAQAEREKWARHVERRQAETTRGVYDREAALDSILLNGIARTRCDPNRSNQGGRPFRISLHGGKRVCHRHLDPPAITSKAGLRKLRHVAQCRQCHLPSSGIEREGSAVGSPSTTHRPRRAEPTIPHTVRNVHTSHGR